MSYYWFNRKKIFKKQKKGIDTKTCQKKKKARLKSTKEKDISYPFSIKMKHYKINEFYFYGVKE